MRVWSVHPQYLDPAGLVALWRETLLARAVRNGATRGYHHHPQLKRFKARAATVGGLSAAKVVAKSARTVSLWSRLLSFCPSGASTSG